MDWEAIAKWLARECAEKIGCSDEGSHPCWEDCTGCWIRKAVKEVDGDGQSGTDRA